MEAATSQAPPIVRGWVQVSTPTQLTYMDTHQSDPISPGSSTTYLTAQIKLLNTIVLPNPSVGSSDNWIPFGTSNTPFRGTFRGQGYAITNVTIDDPSGENVGFFGVAAGSASASGAGLSGGLVGSQDGAIADSYATGSVSGSTGTAGGLVGIQGASAPITDSYFDTTTTGQNLGVGSGVQTGVIGKSDATMHSATFWSGAGWNFTSTWGIVSAAAHTGINSGYPYLQQGLATTLTLSTSHPSSRQSVPVTVTVTYGGLPVAQQAATLTVASGDGTWSNHGATDTGSTASTGQYANTWTAPSMNTATSVTLTAALATVPARTVAQTVQVGAAPPPPPSPSIWIPPVLVPETVTVRGQNAQVIGNLSYNATTAIANGAYLGFVEERAAIEAGATFSGEGTDSSYLSAVLDGSGVGLQQPVSAVQQGQFAALYQKLRIIPTWTDNAVSIQQGVAALVKDHASTLAIENYLVQLDGFSWAAAQSQAAAGFSIQSAT